MNVKITLPKPVKASSAQSLGLPSTLMPVKDYGIHKLRWPWAKRQLTRRMEAAERALEALS